MAINSSNTKTQLLRGKKLLKSTIDSWEAGDYNTIAKLTAEQIISSSQKPTLAALSCMAHLHLGKVDISKFFMSLATEKADNKELMKKLLISDIFSTLAKSFKTIDSPQLAKSYETMSHSLAPSIEGRKIITGNQVPLNSSQPEITSDNLAPLNCDSAREERTATQLISLMLEKLEENTRLVNHHHLELQRTISGKLSNLALQIEAYISLQNYFNHGQHLPSMHGWPVSPDLALYLIDIINRSPYDAVVEFGSGTSTCLIARCLDAKFKSTEADSSCKHVALEHLHEYYDKTLEELKRFTKASGVKLVLAPLSHQQFDNESYYYYECRSELASLSSELTTSQPHILALVDGPPAKTGKHARYPALPLLLESFPTAKIDLLLDDYGRQEEQDIVKHWTRDLDLQGYEYSIRTESMEKDACFLSIQPLTVKSHNTI